MCLSIPAYPHQTLPLNGTHDPQYVHQTRACDL